MQAGVKGSAFFSLVVNPSGPSDILEKALATLDLEESENSVTIHKELSQCGPNLLSSV